MPPSDLPYFASGEVVMGYGRGKDILGIPTANLHSLELNKLPSTLANGIYAGWARIDNGPVYKMVMSIGWNPFFKNKHRSMEVHILHTFEKNFYGCTLSICMVDYLRPERNYDSMDLLIAAMQNDIKNAEKELDKPQFSIYKSCDFLTQTVPTTCNCMKNS